MYLIMHDVYKVIFQEYIKAVRFLKLKYFKNVLFNGYGNSSRCTNFKGTFYFIWSWV